MKAEYFITTKWLIDPAIRPQNKDLKTGIGRQAGYCVTPINKNVCMLRVKG